MKDTEIILNQDIEGENPVLVEGLAGIGHIGTTTVSYLADHLGAEEVGRIDSHYFPPFTVIRDDNTVQLLDNTIYEYRRDDGRNLVLIEGNAQAQTSKGHFEVAEEILEMADDVGSDEIITIGGYGTGEVVEDPEVFGALTHEEVKEDFDDLEVSFDHDVDQIVGASGLLLSLAKQHDMRGACLLGETPGFLLSDPNATEEVLRVLADRLDLDVSYEDLEEKVEESRDVLKKLQSLKKEQSQDQENQNNDLGYIG